MSMYEHVLFAWANVRWSWLCGGPYRSVAHRPFMCVSSGNYTIHSTHPDAHGGVCLERICGFIFGTACRSQNGNAKVKPHSGVSPSCPRIGPAPRYRFGTTNRSTIPARAVIRTGRQWSGTSRSVVVRVLTSCRPVTCCLLLVQCICVLQPEHAWPWLYCRMRHRSVWATLSKAVLCVRVCLQPVCWPSLVQASIRLAP